MKYAFFSIIFALYSILSVAQANNAKQKSSNTIPISKTFIVSEATNRQLPAGLIFANNSFSAKKGYQIVADENGGAKLIDVRDVKKTKLDRQLDMCMPRRKYHLRY